MTMQPQGLAARFTPASIDHALDRLAGPIAQYRWIQDNVYDRDVSQDREFQRRYNHFYRIRNPPTWQRPYYELLESSKPHGIDFATAMRHLLNATGRYEASFASKLVATLRPERPVIDQFVVKSLGLRRPYPGANDRMRKELHVYAAIHDFYVRIVQSHHMPIVRAAFAKRFPAVELTDVKMIDCILWQART